MRRINALVRYLSYLAAIAVVALLLVRGDASLLSAKEPAASSDQNATGVSIDENEWYPVSKIVDGDTIHVAINNENVAVRLIGVDTPETVDPRRPVECFGKEAAAETAKILGTGYARLELDPSQGMRDAYGRVLAYVYSPANIDPKGILVNKYLIAEGFGHEYTFNLPYKYQNDFKAAEKDAERLEKGLWADGACE